MAELELVQSESLHQQQLNIQEALDNAYKQTKRRFIITLCFLVFLGVFGISVTNYSNIFDDSSKEYHETHDNAFAVHYDKNSSNY